jgi:hypothetical protein
MIFDLFLRLYGIGHKSQISLKEHVGNHGRASTQVRFLRKAELRFFHVLEIVTSWMVPSASQKIPLAKNRFLKAGKGAENTKEKSKQCFMSIYTSGNLCLQGTTRQLELKIQFLFCSEKHPC